MTVTAALQKYREMRDFAVTPEPRGSARPRRHEPPVYVIQKHRASHLHDDFRIEIEGVFKSWAVPKGPSLNARDRRLAMQTEDHPLEYAAFEGSIPEGEYGAGRMIVWDRGTYTNLRDEPLKACYSRGRLTILLAGEKLRGAFSLSRMDRGSGASGCSSRKRTNTLPPPTSSATVPRRFCPESR